MNLKNISAFFFILMVAFGIPAASYAEYHHHHEYEQRFGSDCYPHIVSIMDHEVLLSNGYLWKPDRDHYYNYRDLEAVHHLWKAGDKVYFSINGRCSKGHPKGTLYNYELEKLMPESHRGKYSMAGTVHWEHFHDRQRIDYIDSNGHTILLCGGSRWQVGFWSGMTSKHWKEGDLILVSPQYHSHLGEATHTLINISHNLENVNATIITD